MSDELKRWTIVLGEVVAHMPYGLRVRVPSGEIGVLDSAYLDDVPVAPSDWPDVGSRITVVSGGRTSGGQLRLSARPSHLAHARELARTPH
ncbi:hypothetical protein GCM10023196_084680 [Actinoallomurus vinaceus]|uniref:S1 motif domain-containing protein n=1 Tax=Actinoallomurus vinaceus TaxID=1080074 RepID=A0ABP8UQI3_9ACTN